MLHRTYALEVRLAYASDNLFVFQELARSQKTKPDEPKFPDPLGAQIGGFLEDKFLGVLVCHKSGAMVFLRFFSQFL